MKLRFKKDMSKYEKLYNSTCIGGVASVANLKFANLVLNTLRGDLMLNNEGIAAVAEAMRQYISDAEVVRNVPSTIYDDPENLKILSYGSSD